MLTNSINRLAVRLGGVANREEFPLPCLVLLDIDMPGMNGFDALAKIRARSQFLDLPVCMYSSSAEEVDIQRALQLGADCYIQKSINLSTLLELARHIAATWFCPPRSFAIREFSSGNPSVPDMAFRLAFTYSPTVLGMTTGKAPGISHTPWTHIGGPKNRHT